MAIYPKLPSSRAFPMPELEGTPGSFIHTISTMRIPTPVILSAAAFWAVSCQAQNPAPSYQEVVSNLERVAKGAVFPRVISPGWRALGNGRPEMDVSGISRVSFVRNSAPKDVVDIFYHGQDNHRIRTDDPEFVTIMGHKVQTYSSGNEDVAFATQPIRLTAPNEKSAFYSFQFHNERLYKTRDIPQFGW
jgi:hypothetical protein